MDSATLTGSGDRAFRQVLEAVAGIGPVEWIDLIPVPHQHIVIRGRDRMITYDADGEILWGMGRTTADWIAQIMSAIGWPYADNQIFYGLPASTQCHIRPDRFDVVGTTTTPEEIRENLDRPARG